MSIVDAHHHFWDLERNRYPWLQGKMHDRGWGDLSPLQRSYLPADLLADAAGQGLRKSVHLQANYDPSDPAGETRWLEEIALAHGFPHAIVGFADFSSSNVADVLEAHARASARMRGIRQVLNRHPNPVLNRAAHDYLASDVWTSNLGLLRRYGWSFDVQVYYTQMPAIAALARRYADLQFIIDHAGMAVDRDEAGLEGWRQGMKLLAGCPNVVLKLCGYGMVDNRWTLESLRPFVLQPIEWFSPSRCMFGSNFPVDRLMSSYARLWDAFRTITADFAESERRDLFGATAERIYRI